MRAKKKPRGDAEGEKNSNAFNKRELVRRWRKAVKKIMGRKPSYIPP